MFVCERWWWIYLHTYQPYVPSETSMLHCMWVTMAINTHFIDEIYMYCVCVCFFVFSFPFKLTKTTKNVFGRFGCYCYRHWYTHTQSGHPPNVSVDGWLCCWILSEVYLLYICVYIYEYFSDRPLSIFIGTTINSI